MRKLNKLIFIMTFLFFSNGIVHADSLTLQDAIELAQSDGPQAHIVRNDFYRSYWNYQSFKAGILPQLSLNLRTPGLVREINPVTQGDGTVSLVEQNRVYSEVVLSLAQEIPRTGTEFSLSSSLNRYDLFKDDTDDYTLWQAKSLVFGVSQPLFHFNSLKWDTRLERLRYDIARQQYLEDMEDIAIDATSDFFDLYLAQINLEMAELNTAINDTIYQISSGRYNVGSIAENDLLQSELALMNAQTQLAASQLAYDRAEQELRITLGLPDDTPLNLTAPGNVPLFDVDVEAAIKCAKSNRSEWLNYQLQKELAKRNVAAAKGGSGLSATLNASVGLNQSAEDFEDLYKNQLDRQTFDVNVEVPLFQWGQGSSNVKALQAEHRRVEHSLAEQERRFENDVRFEVLDFLNVQDQVAVSARSDTVATRRFLVAKERYLIGKIDITDLFQAQNEKDSTRRTYIRTLRDYWTAYYTIRRMTLHDFVADLPLEFDAGVRP